LSWREEKKRDLKRELLQRLQHQLKSSTRDIGQSQLAKALHISPTLWYHEPRQEKKDEMLRTQIEVVLANNPAYGHKRIALALRQGKRTIRRVMKKYNLHPYKRKARWTKRRDLRRPVAPYQNQIKGICPIKANVIYVCDFTYIPYRGRYVYLATFMDLFTREIVGWHISTRHTKDLVIAAFWEAVMNTGHVPKIVHSDQGSEYTSQEYTNTIESMGITVSMSKKASPWENAYQESYYNNFKTDLGLEFDRFKDLGELVEAIHHTIDYYNHSRIHTTLKMSPAQFKLLYANRVLDKFVNKTGT